MPEQRDNEQDIDAEEAAWEAELARSWSHLQSAEISFGLSVHAKRRKESETTMKKANGSKKKASGSDDLRPEYDFDYRKAKPNRFASAAKESEVIVTLDPDVAKVFTTAEAVNDVLRAIVRAVPGAARVK